MASGSFCAVGSDFGWPVIARCLGMAIMDCGGGFWLLIVGSGQCLRHSISSSLS